MNYFLQGLGVFLGVLAGTAVTLLTQWVLNKTREKQKTRNLRFEFELNIKKIDVWLEELAKYRNAVNGDSVQTYAGYFDLSGAVFPTTNEMFQSGLLYKYLSYEEIGKLQVIFTEFSLFGENYLNKQIADNKANPNKQEAVFNIDFYEKKFKEHKATFSALVRKLTK